MVARRLENCVRESDMLVRLGGDEFVIVLSNIQDLDEIISVIERCRQALNEVFKIGAQEISMTSGIGVSVFPTDGKDVNTLLKNADSAMRVAKRKGINGFSFYKPPSKAEAAALKKMLKMGASPLQKKSNNVIPFRLKD